MGQLEDMQTFVRVVDAGGIGLAAEQMGVAKSAVSRRLSELEIRLGITLINRTTRSSKITKEGLDYYNGSLQLINEISELNSLSANPESLLSGSLRIAAPVSFGLSHLTPALDIFAKDNPELKFHVDLSNRKIDLIEDGFDIAFKMANKLEDSTLKARKIAQIRFHICASPEYLKENGTPETPNDLKNHQLLRLSLPGADSWNLFDKQGKKHVVSTPPRLCSNNSELITNMALSGHGIIRTATFACWKNIKEDKLRPILQDYTLDELYIYAVYPNTRFVSQRVLLLIDFLAEKFGDNPYWDHK